MVSSSPTLTTDARAHRDALEPARRALRQVGIFAAVGLGLSLVAATTGLGLPCPFRAATGLQCPLCGATTMGVALLHLDPATAWRANGFVLVALCVLGLCSLVWLAELVTGRRWWPSGWPGSLDRWLALAAVVGVVFAVVRELG